MTEPTVHIQWVFTWANAVEQQRRRIMEAPNLSAAQPDVLMFAAAIGGLLNTATRDLGPNHPALQRFDEAVPDGKIVRDIASHLEAYSNGEGRLQGDPQAKGKVRLADGRRAGRLTTLMRGVDGSIEITLFGFNLNISTAADAAADLAAAALDARA